ncbi:selenocysteine-specific translation elongation factor [uncultured Pseudokineococcus sp.]|uniref:selenocysteine-specific translation elongation factor n=1 Tax=uncultured Pseudokineococcus sp. TaxID=1642928 RepID=UPI0026126F4D|nr:selenocysteine-specific translation elongation factor [uncultured Pseudokineococcus sp.]
MHVLATAGHVDHGKSALVRALTGREPDRWAEEQRRGLTLDLGFAWTDLDDGAGGAERVALVDVPGHERFVPTMLAGVGPVPAVLLVVAADGGWMPQSQEHLDALDALGVRSGLVVVSRADLVDAAGAAATAADVAQRLVGTSLAGSPSVVVSARTGAGTDALRAAVVGLVRGLPPADPGAPPRLWLDRSFTIRGAGTVVTGTLPEGVLRTGDELEAVTPDGERRSVRVRGLQSLEEPRPEVAGPARVAVNLRGASAGDVPRGSALLAPGSARLTCEVDVVLTGAVRARALADDGPATAGVGRDALPLEALLHVGAAQVSARPRALGRTGGGGASGDGAEVVRLRLRTPLPLRTGDLGLLRDPGRRAVLAGVRVLDVDPPPLTRRGAARARAADLAVPAALLVDDAAPDARARRQALLDDEVRRRGVAAAADLVRAGHPAVLVRDRLRRSGTGAQVLDPRLREELRQRLVALVAQDAAADPLAGGTPLEAARHRLGVPDLDVVRLLAADVLVERDGRLVAPAPPTPAPPTPAPPSTAAPTPTAPSPAPSARPRPTTPSPRPAGGPAPTPRPRPALPSSGRPTPAGPAPGSPAPGKPGHPGSIAPRSSVPPSPTERTSSEQPAAEQLALDQLPPPVAAAVREVLADLRAEPFRAPEAHRLRDLGLGPRELGAAVRVGALVRVGDVVLAPGALDAAAAALAALPSPFTTSEARQAWGTSRRVALPLLEALDASGRTARQPDDRRRLR